MSIYRRIVKEFQFLETRYGFHIRFKQTSGAYFYVEWVNSKICIKVLFDYQVEDPMTIFTYDAESLGTVYDAIEYKNEFACPQKSPRDQIHHAAEWLYNAISTGLIVI